MNVFTDKVTEEVIGDENPRIAVVGPMASGKSTLARQLAYQLAVPYVDCDGLYWQANWTPTPVDVLRKRMAEALAPERWVTDGNIGRLRNPQLPRITTLVWLDYSLWVCMPRLLRRTLRRVLRREITHGGNRETFAQQFLSRDSVFLYLLRRHAGLRQHYQDMIAAEDAEHVHIIRLTSPRQTRDWLRSQPSVFPQGAVQIRL